MSSPRQKSVSIKWTRQTKIRPPVRVLKVMLMGAPHPHRIISGDVAGNLHQEAPKAFARAVIAAFDMPLGTFACPLGTRPERVRGK